MVDGVFEPAEWDRMLLDPEGFKSIVEVLTRWFVIQGKPLHVVILEHAALNVLDHHTDTPKSGNARIQRWIDEVHPKLVNKLRRGPRRRVEAVLHACRRAMAAMDTDLSVYFQVSA